MTTSCFWGFEGCNCGADNFDAMQAAAELDAGYTVVNFEPGLPFSADLLAALLLTDEELEMLGLEPANPELEAALGEVEVGNFLTNEEGAVLADEIFRLEDREDELTEALAEAEADVDALSAEKAELAEDLDDLAVENIVVWLANAELKDQLDISTTLNLVGSTALFEAAQQLQRQQALIRAQQLLIDIQEAELRRLRGVEAFRAFTASQLYLG